MSKDKALDIVLSEFLELAKVPRPSHHEERVSEYLFQWAKRHGLAVEKDNMNEIIIDKPASPGCENVPRVIFQAHMDMVCVCEEGVTYDPMNDPIKVINDGVTLTADGTSLGADDGIGVAMCLYLLQDDTLRHGPIRAIFTTNEEDGMDSMDIDPKYLDGDYPPSLENWNGHALLTFNSHIRSWQMSSYTKPMWLVVRPLRILSITIPLCPLSIKLILG